MILPRLQANLLEILHEQQSNRAGNPAQQNIGAALVGDLSKISGEFDEHRNLLFGKLSDLLSERFEFHARRCPTPGWARRIRRLALQNGWRVVPVRSRTSHCI